MFKINILDTYTIRWTNNTIKFIYEPLASFKFLIYIIRYEIWDKEKSNLIYMRPT